MISLFIVSFVLFWIVVLFVDLLELFLLSLYKMVKKEIWQPSSHISQIMFSKQNSEKLQKR